MENVKLDLIPGRVMPICHASQYDVGRVIRFNLVENDVPYVLDGTETVTFGERKIDGNVVTAACVVTATKSYVDLETTKQMCACYGQNLCELKIEKGSDIIGTLNFVLDVERDPLEGGIQSESEIYNLQVQINEIIQQELENYDIYGAYVTEQISGAVANFTDGADNVPVKALSVEFAATQASGTPTPSAPIPIVGVDKVNVVCCGKNLLSMKIYDGGSYNPAVGTQWNLTESTNEFTRNGNAYSITASSTWRYFTVLMPLKSGIDYLMHLERASTGSDAVSYIYLDKDFKVLAVANNTQTPYTTNSALNPPANTAYYALVFTNRSTANCTITITNPYVIVGLTATEYEPYNGTTALINLGGTYYGGSVDAVTGKITLTHGVYTFDGSETWTQYVGGVGVYFTLALSAAKHANEQIVICDHYQGQLSGAGNSNYPDLSTWLTNTENYKRLYVKNSNFESTSDAQSGMNGVTVVYPLATPIVVYASNTAEISTILGVNNIFSDAGDVDVTYRADTALYIDKRLNA